jgi:hypothetical protein
MRALALGDVVASRTDFPGRDYATVVLLALVLAALAVFFIDW